MQTNNSDFLHKIIIPFFIGTVDKDIISAVYDAEGKILIATNLYARLWGYKNYKDIVGSSLAELLKFVDSKEIVAQLEEIRQMVIREKKVINFINFMPFNDSIAMLLAYHYPIFNPDGEVVATRVLSEQASLFNHSVEVFHHFKPEEGLAYPSIKPIAPEKIKLSKRQQEILYLLKIGFSQNDAANYLGITRGALSKIISSQICPQFHIDGSNTKLLVKRVIKSGYFKHIPKSLLKPKIIKIENDFEFLID